MAEPGSLLLILAAYLLGSVSFSLWIVRALHGFDLRHRGSGNAGATNVLRTAGRRAAISVLVLDVAKGWAVVMVARGFGAPGPVVGTAALAAVVGHVFPVFSQLRGGKGVATFFGAMGTLAPRPALLALGLLAGIAAVTRYVSLGSVIAVGLFPPLILLLAWLGWGPPAPAWLLVVSALAAALILFKHRHNLGRLARGREHRLDRSADPGKAA